MDLDSLLNNSNKNVNEKVSGVKQLSLFNEKKSQIENPKEIIQHKQQNKPKQNNTSPDVMINKIAQNVNKSNETNFNETKIKVNEVINKQKTFESLQQFEEQNGKLKIFEINVNEQVKHQTNVNKEENVNNEWFKANCNLNTNENNTRNDSVFLKSFNSTRDTKHKNTNDIKIWLKEQLAEAECCFNFMRNNAQKTTS